MFPLLRSFSINNYHSHFDIINGTVTTGGCGLLDHFHDIKALLYLTEYGVLTVKVWRAANGSNGPVHPITRYFRYRQSGSIAE